MDIGHLVTTFLAVNLGSFLAGDPRFFLLAVLYQFSTNIVNIKTIKVLLCTRMLCRMNAVGTLRLMEINVERLKELRNARVMSVRELADEAGVSKTTVFNIEHGSSNAQARTIRKLAKALGVEPSELVKT